MPELSGNEPAVIEYFNNEFKKYGIFTPASIISPHLIQAINQRQPENSNQFEASMNSFVNALEKNPAAYKDLLALLERMKAKGIVEMIKNRILPSANSAEEKSTQQYHGPEHIGEIAHDVEKILRKQLEEKNVGDVLKEVFIGIATSAVAWHDVIQLAGPPANEAKSAEAYAAELKILLAEFKKNYPPMENEINAFEKQLAYITDALIIQATWLVWAKDQNNAVITKPCSEYVESVANDLRTQSELKLAPEAELQNHPCLDCLYGAADAISQSDTNRFSLEHVINAHEMLAASKKLSPEASKALENFFQEAAINSPAEREAFLGLMGQNIRMFTELNKPYIPEIHTDPKKYMNLAQISLEDHRYFNQALDELRSSAPTSEDKSEIDYKRLFNLFMETQSKKANPKEEKRNIEREVGFASAQQSTLWQEHAHRLKQFDKYVKNFPADSVARIALGEAFLQLATRYQPGLQLLQNDKAFKLELETAANPGRRFSTGASQSNLGLFSTTPAEIARKKQELANLQGAMEVYLGPSVSTPQLVRQQ